MTATSVLRVPRATYRLQLHRDFDFAAATRIVPYLARLGISHVYCSPVLRARPGSTHGYDITVFDEINPELGGMAGFQRFSAALRAHDMGLLFDMVPNHMGVLGADNLWWMDVLENGPASLYAGHFDIDWRPANPQLNGKVLVPVLGEHYGAVLDKGDLLLHFERSCGTLALHYGTHRFPLNPRSYPVVLERAAALTDDAAARTALSALAAAFARLPVGEGGSAEMAQGAQARDLHKASLARCAESQSQLLRGIDAALRELNSAERRDALHELLEAQSFRLAYWRVASDEINYRRFFDINELAALRMESEAVFEATHGFVLDLAASGMIDGLRIDHPDGLRDPAQYFCRLQEGYRRRSGQQAAGNGDDEYPLYVVIEKITAPHEKLPDTWQCHGSTGYRFMNVMNGVLVDAAAHHRFARIWRNFTHSEQSFEEIAYYGKRAIMQSVLAAERTRLANELLRIAQDDRATRDYTFNTLRDALVEVVACLPVYRTYLIDKASVQDLRYIDWAVAQARQRNHDIDASVFDFVRRTLLAESDGEAADGLRGRMASFAQRFQQFSAPVAAKGVEDTAFYRYSRLVSLNEVGGDPALFGTTVRAFHGASGEQAQHWPHTLLATSTHDNKRAEDVRNRIDVLSEMPAAWRLMLRRWSLQNRRHKSRTASGVAPSAADEYLLYQTLLGSVPVMAFGQAALDDWRGRIERYMQKAAREAKLHTSWVNPNAEYEAALGAFIGALLKRIEPNPFLDDLRRQAAALAWFGALNSLSMALIKFTAPGVPDIYQGNELMDLSLVDPDNRRPVDYALREHQLESLTALAQTPALAEKLSLLAAEPYDGRAKLWLTWRLLDFRRRTPALFDDGSYTPLRVTGAHAHHVIAYARQHSEASSDGTHDAIATTLVVIAGRLFSQLPGNAGKPPLGDAVWADTAVELPLADGVALENVISGRAVEISGGRLPLAQAFADFPAVALVAQSPLRRH